MRLALTTTPREARHHNGQHLGHQSTVFTTTSTDSDSLACIVDTRETIWSEHQFIDFFQATYQGSARPTSNPHLIVRRPHKVCHGVGGVSCALCVS